jgi:hypothetical protein
VSTAYYLYENFQKNLDRLWDEPAGTKRYGELLRVVTGTLADVEEGTAGALKGLDAEIERMKPSS